MKKMRKTAIIAAISLLVLSFVTFFSGIQIMRAEKGGAETNKTGEITDVITVKSPIQGSTVTLDNEKIADYFGVTVEYLKGEETKKDPGQKTEVEIDGELLEIWNTGDEDEHRALLEMARLIKSRRK